MSGRGGRGGRGGRSRSREFNPGEGKGVAEFFSPLPSINDPAVQKARLALHQRRQSSRERNVPDLAESQIAAAVVHRTAYASGRAIHATQLAQNQAVVAAPQPRGSTPNRVLRSPGPFKPQSPIKKNAEKAARQEMELRKRAFEEQRRILQETRIANGTTAMNTGSGTRPMPNIRIPKKPGALGNLIGSPSQETSQNIGNGQPTPNHENGSDNQSTCSSGNFTRPKRSLDVASSSSTHQMPPPEKLSKREVHTEGNDGMESDTSSCTSNIPSVVAEQIDERELLTRRLQTLWTERVEQDQYYRGIREHIDILEKAVDAVYSSKNPLR